MNVAILLRFFKKRMLGIGWLSLCNLIGIQEIKSGWAFYFLWKFEEQKKSKNFIENEYMVKETEKWLIIASHSLNLK